MFAVLRQHSNPMLAWVARITLETGMRSPEIASQVDVKCRVVRLTDTKNNEARLVPLTFAATGVFFGEPGGMKGEAHTIPAGHHHQVRDGGSKTRQTRLF